MNHKLVAITGALMLSLGACTPAQTASYNLSNDSDNFRVMRRVVNRFESEGILHDADVLLEQDHVNVLIDPGHEA